MMPCAYCGGRLNRVRTKSGHAYVCGNCNSRGVGIAVLKKHSGSLVANELWQRARQEPSAGRSCPSCLGKMGTAHVEGELELDLCHRCALVWCDPGEFDSLPIAGPISPVELKEPAREAVARLRAKSIKTQSDAEGDEPEERWQWIAGFFGMPVELESPHRNLGIPILTWSISAILILVYVLTFNTLETAVKTWGMIPKEVVQRYGITVLSSFFLHAGLLHLIGNLYFLMVFGDNVEDDLGTVRYLLLLFFATVAGAILHMLGDANSQIPCVGASGGISGVISYYALKFPYARLGILFRWYFYYHWVSISAIWALAFWALMQVITSYIQLGGGTNVSGLAHLGGAAVGAMATILWRDDE